MQNTWPALASVVIYLNASVSLANSDNGTQDVVAVGLHDSGHALVTLAGSANTEGCATPSARNMVLLDKNNPNFKLMYATALAAHASERKIFGWVNGCVDVWGTGSFVVVKATTLSVR